jgi:hypothetical protein
VSLGPQPPPNRRTGLIIAAVAAGVVILAAVGTAAAVLLGGDDTSASGADRPTATKPAVDDVGSEPSSEASADPAAEQTDVSSPEPALATCWDGSSAVRVRDCSTPTGFRGLRWVFPSIDDSATCYRGGAAKYERPTMRTCYDQLADGTQIKFNYSEWSDLSLALDHYDSTSYEKGPWPGGLTRWLIISHDGDYKAALMYPGNVYSVTVYAPTASARDRAIVQLLRTRPVRQLRGTPA